ncbi:DUF1351 domain-containing protein [Marinobacter sp. 71-i]|uniref:DUF1351 domain-containing protein n=1 Tax=Marinobacter iranensis TaxID=2962607 RepID=A0ABT5Y9J0_9GAMM|nr:DUF1351 domain-containing protein [Marinobacter iranensis]MDF0750335.1 DUF1351 domain-containing protein [Marinobacter iranensis]
MQELITINNTPALVEVNFEELKKHLATELEKYNVVVTQDTVKDAKALATELNKTKGEIAKRKKEEYDRATAGANQFKDGMKELEAMIDVGRKGLLEQVQKFEDETRQLAADLLREKRSEMWESFGVTEEFQSAQFDDLANLSAVTAKGNLAAGARTKLESRVNADKALQDQTEMRLLKLENQSYKAGLSAPLTRSHVEHFLFDEDDTYQQKLDALMKSELGREEVAQNAMRAKMEREQQEKAQAEQRRHGREERAAAAQAEAQRTVPDQPEQEAAPERAAPEASKPQPEHEPAQPGRVPVTVQCTFNVNVTASTTDEAIEAELRRVLEKAGIKTLDTVEVIRQREAA